MVRIDPDSFSGKLVLNGIDKLVFTLMLFLIFAFWTDQQRETERSSMRVEKIQSIEIERPITLVERLSGPVLECLLLVRADRDFGVDKEKIRPLLIEIMFHAEMMENYAGSSDRRKTYEAAGRLVRIVGDFGLLVSQSEPKRSDYKKFGDELTAGFDSLFQSTVEDVATLSGTPRT